MVTPSAAGSRPSLRALELGMGWFPQQRGGLNRVFYQLCRHLPSQGVEVEAVVDRMRGTEQGPGWSATAVAPPAASIVGRIAAGRRVLGPILRSRRHDLVAVHFALTLWPAVGSLAALPMVVHFHGPWARERRAEGGGAVKAWAARAIERRVYGKGCRFVVLSRSFGKVLSRDYGVPEDLVRLVPGGVDAERFAAAASRHDARRRLGWPADRPVVVSVRRLVRRMGLGNLLAAVSLVRNTVPDIWLAVVGTGPQRARLERLAVDLGLEGTVVFVGALPDDLLPLAYRAADISVLPSVTLEGFGLPAVESLAAGTAVLGTPVGGIPEVLTPLASDLVCEGTSSAQIAQRIEAALRGTIRLPGEEACRTYAREGFDWPVVARQVRAVYDEAVTKGR